MAMGDKCSRYGRPGIHVEAARLAPEAIRIDPQQGHSGPSIEGTKAVSHLAGCRRNADRTMGEAEEFSTQGRAGTTGTGVRAIPRSTFAARSGYRTCRSERHSRTRRGHADGRAY